MAIFCIVSEIKRDIGLLLQYNNPREETVVNIFAPLFRNADRSLAYQVVLIDSVKKFLFADSHAHCKETDRRIVGNATSIAECLPRSAG